MKINVWNIRFLVYLFSLLLLTSCTTEKVEPETDPIIYFGSGKHWDVRAELSNENEQFLIKFSYKRDIEDLRELERLQFFVGTRLGTNSYTFLDNLLDEGDSPLDIYFIDFQNINSKVFNIQFPNTTNSNTVKDLSNTIKTDGFLINVSWGKGHTDYSDEIKISGCP